MCVLQVTAPAVHKLQRWQQRIKDSPFDLYVANRRVVHTKNWLVRVSPALKSLPAVIINEYHAQHHDITMFRNSHGQDNETAYNTVVYHRQAADIPGLHCLQPVLACVPLIAVQEQSSRLQQT